MISIRLNGELSEWRTAWLAAHLRHCAACATYAQRFATWLTASGQAHSSNLTLSSRRRVEAHTREHDPRSSRSGRRRGIHQRRRLAWQTRTPAAKRRPGERPRVVPADRRAPPASSGRERKKLDEAVIPSLRRTAQHSTRRWLDARSPLAISDSRRMGGAFMEPSGRNRWQSVANRTRSKTAQTGRPATGGNPRQPFRSAW